MPRRPILPYLVLFAGVLVVSTASILIRYAQQEGVSSLAIATWRLTFAALVLAPIAWARVAGEIRGLGRRELLLGAGSGAFLAVHFASWISSLEYTSVASSAALVATNPLWVGLASLLVFRERLGPAAIAGIALTFAGTVAISVSDSQASSFSNPLLGNSLALIGAAASSAYLIIGRSLRRRLSTLAYIWLVYTSAAVVLLLWASLARQQLLGYSPLAYLLLLGLALGPQLLGHTSFNYALSAVSATFVALSIMGEPVGSALLALLLFNERFEALQLGGFVLLLAGITIAALGEARPAAPPAPQAAEHRGEA